MNDFPTMLVETKMGEVTVEFYDRDLIVLRFDKLRVHNVVYHGYLRLRQYDGGNFTAERNEHGHSAHAVYMTRSGAMEEGTPKARGFVRESLWPAVWDEIATARLVNGEKQTRLEEFNLQLLRGTELQRKREFDRAEAEMIAAEKAHETAVANMRTMLTAWKTAQKELEVFKFPNEAPYLPG